MAGVFGDAREKRARDLGPAPRSLDDAIDEVPRQLERLNAASEIGPCQRA